MLLSGIIGSKQYRLYENSANFEDARLECSQFGGDLAIIKSGNVNEVLRLLISNSMTLSRFRRARYTFIGMTRQNRGAWFYLDNTIVPLPNGGSNNGYHNWGEREPNNSGRNEECGSTSQFGFWNDISCRASLDFICEKGKIINRC